MDISIVVPVYNEERNILPLSQQIETAIKHLDYEIIFVDDGSTDQSLHIVQTVSQVNPRVKGISLSRNFGKNAAEICGLTYAKGNYVVIMDGDLQHPPATIQDMFEKVKKGYDVILGVRKNYSPGLFKKIGTSLFQYLFMTFSDFKYDHKSSDFILMSRKVVTEILRLSEYSRFNRALFQWVGFKREYVEFDVSSRASGSTSWSTKGLIGLGLNGLTSYSGRPLRVSIYMGLIFGFLAFIYTIYAIFQVLNDNAVSGWASLLITNLIMGSLILIQIGVVGEYLFKTYMEVKGRPLFITDEMIGFTNEEKE